MALLDFIDVIDDIIDLSSDDEAVHQDQNASQPHAALLDKQAVFVLAGEKRQDEQAAFVSAGEGSQEAKEYGNALVATTSPSVMEKVSLDTVEPKNCPNSPTSAPHPSLTSTTPKAMTSEVGDTQLVATASPLVMKEVPLDTAESKNCPISLRTASFPSPAFTTPKDLTSEVGRTQLVATAPPSAMEKAPLDTAETKNSSSSQTSAPLPSPASTTPKDLTSEVGDTQLVATSSPSVMEKAPLDTAESKNSSSSSISAPLSSPASTTPKAMIPEVGDAKLTRLKHPKKKYHTGTPRRSPRFEQKRECCDSPVEEPAADPKRSRMLEPAEGSASSANSAGSIRTVSTEY